jgi:hypothetical protein
MSNEFVVKKGLIVQSGQTQITNSLIVAGPITATSFTGSFSGSISTADFAEVSSRAQNNA